MSVESEVIPSIDRQIYSYWSGGNMNSTRQECYNTMLQILSVPIVLVTDENIRGFFEATGTPVHPGFWLLTSNHKSDYIRSYFMNFHGGAYSDIKMPTQSWVQAFADLDACNSEIYGNGVRELAPEHLGYWEDMMPSEKIEVAAKYAEFLSNGCFIFRPHTPFTEAWYKATQTTMDKYYDELKQYREGAGAYPIRYVELQGEIFHRLVNKYLGHFIYTLPSLDYSKPYR